MPNILNQEEVDALLKTVGQEESEDGEPEGDAALAAPSPPSSYCLYDFKRPERVSKEQVAALEALHEASARNISASLSGYLRTIVEVKLISVEQFTYSEFTMSLPSPTSFNLLTARPLEGNVILEVNPSILFPMIDRLLGGGKTEAFLLDRPFTSIETGLVSSILHRIIEQLNETWQSIKNPGRIRFEIVESESNLFLTQIIAPNEPVVLLSFEILMGEYSGMINLCIPFKVMEPIMPQFTHSNWLAPRPGSRTSRTETILGLISGSAVEVSAILAETEIRLQDLLELEPGDIIDTGKHCRQEMVLAIEGVSCFRGATGTCKSRKALRITRTLLPGEGATPKAPSGS